MRTSIWRTGAGVALTAMLAAVGVTLPASPAVAAGSTYYVSSSSGDDAASGLCADAAPACGPWRTLDALNSRTFQPGDRILLRRGDVWTGQTVAFTESGAAGEPIVLSAYGSGARPLIRPRSIDSTAITLDGVGHFTVSGIAIAEAYQGVLLRYEDVSDKRDVLLTDLDVRDLTPAYNSDYFLYNHTSSGVSVKTYQTASDGPRGDPTTRRAALTNFRLTDSTFTNVGTATWFGGLITDPTTGFQADHHQWTRDVTMSGLTVDGGRLWGFNVLFVEGGRFTDMTALDTGGARNRYGTAAVVVAYADNIEFSRLTVRGVARHPEIQYDSVGFDYEGVGRNISLTDSVVDDTDGPGIFVFDNSSSPNTDILMKNVTVARYGANHGSADTGEAIRIQPGGSGSFTDVRLLDAYGRPVSVGPLANYNPVGLTETDIATTFMAPLPAPAAEPIGAPTATLGTPVAPRNDSSHEVGMKFSTTATGLDVHGLGRAWLAGNLRPHTVTLYRASDGVALGACKVGPDDLTRANGVKYCDLPRTIALAPNTQYWVLSTEYIGGDSWGDSGTLASSSAVSVLGAGSRTGAGAFTVWNAGGRSYGPVDVLSSPSGSVVQRLGFEEAGGAVAVDKSARAVDGTVSDTTTRAFTGASGSGQRFDGLDDVVTVADAPALESMPAVTVAAWVRLGRLAAPGAAAVVVGKDGTAPGDYSYRVVVAADGSAHFVVQTSGAPWYSAGTLAQTPVGAVASGTWVHLAGTYDGTRTRLFVNGSLAATGATSISGTIANSSAPLRVGASPAANIAPLAGVVDEVLVVREAWNASVIAALVAGYRP